MDHHDTHFWIETWVAISFVIFVVLVGAKGWKTLTGLLDKRAAKIRDDLAEASRLRQEAEALLKDAQQRRTAALAEAEALVKGAADEAQRVVAAAEADARATAARREKMAMERIAAAEKAAVDEVRATAADISAAAAREVLAATATPDRQAALIDRGIAGIPQALRAA